MIANNGAEDDLRDLFPKAALPTLLSQHLTVLAQRRPAIFRKALFCMALALLVSRTMGLERSDVEAAYISGLVHDIGLLHIDPHVLDKTGTLDADEWRAVQSHVVVGKMMLENLPGVCPRAARAVLEHHEQFGGTGYPTGKADDDLDPLGQIIAMADALQAIRVNQFAPQGLNLASAMPYLHMNATTHFYAVYEAVHTLLKRSGLKAARSTGTGDLTTFAGRLLARGAVQGNIIRPLMTVERVIPTIETGCKGCPVLRLAGRVLRMLRSSGMFQDELAQWLDHIHRRERTLEGALEELNTIELMQRELTWQLGSVRRALDEFLGRECDERTPNRELLVDALTQVNDCVDGLKA